MVNPRNKDCITNRTGNNNSSTCPTKVEILYMCPVCNWAFRGSLFWRHIAKKHPGHKVDKVKKDKMNV